MVAVHGKSTHGTAIRSNVVVLVYIPLVGSSLFIFLVVAQLQFFYIFESTYMLRTLILANRFQKNRLQYRFFIVQAEIITSIINIWLLERSRKSESFNSRTTGFYRMGGSTSKNSSLDLKLQKATSKSATPRLHGKHSVHIC